MVSFTKISLTSLLVSLGMAQDLPLVTSALPDLTVGFTTTSDGTVWVMNPPVRTITFYNTGVQPGTKLVPDNGVPDGYDEFVTMSPTTTVTSWITDGSTPHTWLLRNGVEVNWETPTKTMTVFNSVATTFFRNGLEVVWVTPTATVTTFQVDTDPTTFINADGTAQVFLPPVSTRTITASTTGTSLDEDDGVLDYFITQNLPTVTSALAEMTSAFTTTSDGTVWVMNPPLVTMTFYQPGVTAGTSLAPDGNVPDGYDELISLPPTATQTSWLFDGEDAYTEVDQFGNEVDFNVPTGTTTVTDSTAFTTVSGDGLEIVYVTATSTASAPATTTSVTASATSQVSLSSPVSSNSTFISTVSPASVSTISSAESSSSSSVMFVTSSTTSAVSTNTPSASAIVGSATYVGKTLQLQLDLPVSLVGNNFIVSATADSIYSFDKSVDATTFDNSTGTLSNDNTTGQELDYTVFGSAVNTIGIQFGLIFSEKKPVSLNMQITALSGKSKRNTISFIITVDPNTSNPSVVISTVPVGTTSNIPVSTTSNAPAGIISSDSQHSIVTTVDGKVTTLMPTSSLNAFQNSTSSVSVATETITNESTTVITTCPTCMHKETTVGLTTVTATVNDIVTSYTTFCPLSSLPAYTSSGVVVSPTVVFSEISSGVYHVSTSSVIQKASTSAEPTRSPTVPSEGGDSTVSSTSANPQNPSISTFVEGGANKIAAGYVAVLMAGIALLI